MACIFRKRSCCATFIFSFISNAWVWKDEIFTDVLLVRSNLVCICLINSSCWVTNPWLACEFRWSCSRIVCNYWICCRSWALIFSKSWFILFLTVCSMACILVCKWSTSRHFFLSYSTKLFTYHWFVVEKVTNEPMTSLQIVYHLDHFHHTPFSAFWLPLHISGVILLSWWPSFSY